MPSNAERMNAVLVTGAIVLGGGWVASLIPSASAAQSQEPVKEATHEVSGNSQSFQAAVAADRALSQTEAKTMRVTINGVRNNAGKVYAILFDDRLAYQDYDVERVADLKIVNTRQGTLSLEFTDPSDRAYVVAVFHDENGNHDFDMSGGYPIEGYGTLRANSPYDELTFDQASVPVAPASVQIHYLH